VLTRTSTYDKLDDKAETSSLRAVDSDAQTLTAGSPPHSSEPLVSSPLDSKAVDDSGRLSEAVIRRARRLVEQADQIQTRRVSPPQSIRLSGGLQGPDDVIQRPSERQLNAVPRVSDASDTSASERRPATDADQPSSSAAGKTKPSPVRKFGFMGLWRRQRAEQAAGVDDQRRAESSSDRTSPRRRAFSWWRRTATSPSTAASNSDAGGRGTSTRDVAARPRSPCRAAVVAPFSYRPSPPAPPAMFADLPDSHQTKTAMLIERRNRRLKLASESSGEQPSKPDVTSPRRKNLLVTTV